MICIHVLNRFRENVFGGDYVFSVSREFLRQCEIPRLVMPGDDPPHRRRYEALNRSFYF